MIEFEIIEVKKKLKDSDSRSHRIERKPRIYFFHQDESLLENLVEREFRPSKEYRKLFPVIEKEYLQGEKIRAKWSQYAGCTMCPCSPGFIVESPQSFSSMYITIKIKKT